MADEEAGDKFRKHRMMKHWVRLGRGGELG